MQAHGRPVPNYTEQEAYELQTIHGPLVVQPVENWNEHGSPCLSLMTQFKETDGTLPILANKYSGKWNFHFDCKKGEGDIVAHDVINIISDILGDKQPSI